MEKFVKKYSTVPNAFIEEFFNIAKEDYGDKDPLIDFNSVTKWLDVQKRHLKRLLVKYFAENSDYSITQRKQLHPNGSGATYVEDIMITPDCFKQLCMISQTPKAKEVRQYYLSIEKLIKRYHTYIEEQLRKKINALEQNQKPKVNVEGGVIYFFKALNNITEDELGEELGDDLYKIGKTSNKKTRFEAYNTGNAMDVEPLFILEVKDIDKVELCIKNLLKSYQYRKHREIYKVDIDTLKHAFGMCDGLIDGFKYYIDKNSNKKADANFRKMRRSNNGIFMVFQKNKKK